MELSDEEAIEILKGLKAKTPQYIIEAREYTKTLRALVEGDDFKDLLSKIEHIELSDKKWKARERYSRSIKDLNERLLRPIENIFSATGGSTIPKLKQESNTEKITSSLQNCVGNKSLRKWMSTTWKDAWLTDPNGVVLIEVNKEATKSYPTYKSINVISGYESRGQNVEWIAFTPVPVVGDESKMLQRIIDDKTDRTYLLDGDKFSLVPDLTFSHSFGVCPALINGDRIKIGYDKFRLSFVDRIIEIQKEYLRDQSILTIVKFLNGFKNLVRPKVLCTSCHGLGQQGEENQSCDSCQGTGYMINKDVTDEIILPIDPTNPEQQFPSATDIASYIGLDTETWNQYRDELKVLEVLMYEALWGTHMTNQENTTATAKFIDTQPVINRLNSISDNAEFIEWQIAELMSRFYVPTYKEGESMISLTYGRRFIIDPPDALLETYLRSRENGLNTVILDKQFNEYLTGKYKGDHESLRVSILKSKVEPHTHYTIEQINLIYGKKEAIKKGLFQEWWETLNEVDFLKTDIQLREAFKVYFEQYMNDNPIETEQQTE